MTEMIARPSADEAVVAETRSRGTGQSGAATFSDLVRAHFKWDAAYESGDRPEREAAKQEYDRQLAAFEREEGKLAAVYWSTQEASAVAMTMLRRDGLRSRLNRWNKLVDTESEIRLHRVSDWVTRDAAQVADLLHECDLLAIRVGEVLRGTSQRIALRWILAVEAHLLGFIERTGRRRAKEEESKVVDAQREQLVRIERYYHRAATKAGRIVYVGGMMLGVALLAIAVTAVALVLWPAGVPTSPEGQAILLSIGAGAVGALVSAMARMGAGPERFKVDFEVGRPLLRRLGTYRPLVGAVFGVAAYFLLASGLLNTQQPADPGVRLYFWGTVAFFAGFSERFTNVIFGSAQRMITGAEGKSEDDEDPDAGRRS
jgi:hypothetical protein